MVRLTDRLDMTILVDWDVKPQKEKYFTDNVMVLVAIHKS